MTSDPMRAFLSECGYSLMETTKAKSCELWTNGVEAVTLAVDENNCAYYAVQEDHSMEELSLQELRRTLMTPLPQTA